MAGTFEQAELGAAMGIAQMAGVGHRHAVACFVSIHRYGTRVATRSGRMDRHAGHPDKIRHSPLDGAITG